MEEKKYTAKIILEGKEKFINDSNEIKESLKDLDGTAKQLNESLEKTAKLLSELRWLRGDGMSYKTSTYLPDSLQAHTTVSFSLSHRDWCELEKTIEWVNFVKVLEEYQNKDNRQHNQVLEWILEI